MNWQPVLNDTPTAVISDTLETVSTSAKTSGLLLTQTTLTPLFVGSRRLTIRGVGVVKATNTVVDIIFR